MISEFDRLLFAHMQIENILKLIKDNEWEEYMSHNLFTVKYELERQISNAKQREKNQCASSENCPPNPPQAPK